MSSYRYHINPDTGRPNICSASKRGCKYAVNGQEPKHYYSKAEAQKASEQINAATYGNFSSLKKDEESNSLKTAKNNSEVIKMFPKKPVVFSETEATNNIVSMIAEHETMLHNLDDVKQYALGYYSMSGHRDINGFLRHGDISYYYDRDVYAYDPQQKAEITNLIKQRIEVLDQLLAEHGNGKGRKPKVLYRFIRVPNDETPENFLAKLSQNEVISDDGYISTTEDPSFIHSHITQAKRRNEKYVVLEMLTSKGISMQNAMSKSGNVQSLEQERLLPRKTAFTCVSQVSKTFRTGDDRSSLLRHYAPYSPYPDYAPKPAKARRLHCLQLVDVDLLES